MNRSLAIFVLALCAASARAQFAVYGMGSAGRLSGFSSTASSPGTVPTASFDGGNFWAYGGTAGIYDDFLKLGPIKLGGDARGFVQSSSSNFATSGTNTNQLRGGLFGLRLAGSAPLVPVKPYIQAEIGAGNTNFGGSTTSTTGLIYQVQVGADFTIFPHLDIRAEYGAGQFVDVSGFGTNDTRTLQQAGLGVVLRF
jgi:Outer membrane protein beta-barrel domain